MAQVYVRSEGASRTGPSRTILTGEAPMGYEDDGWPRVFALTPPKFCLWRSAARCAEGRCGSPWPPLPRLAGCGRQTR